MNLYFLHLLQTWPVWPVGSRLKEIVLPRAEGAKVQIHICSICLGSVPAFRSSAFLLRSSAFPAFQADGLAERLGVVGY